jgi:hypothetical protein
MKMFACAGPEEEAETLGRYLIKSSNVATFS